MTIPDTMNSRKRRTPINELADVLMDMVMDERTASGILRVHNQFRTTYRITYQALMYSDTFRPMYQALVYSAADTMGVLGEVMI